MFSTPPSFHRVLIKWMKILGYRSNDEGVCYGFACMAMQAILANDLKTFEDRLDLIYKTSDLKTKIDAIKQKVIAREKLSPEEIKLAEIPAFFEGIELYFQPDLYPDVFPKASRPTRQNAKLTSPLVNSSKLEEQGGIHVDETNIFSGIYTVAELTEYFRSLADVIKEKEPPSFALLLSSSNHTITVSYSFDNINRQWRILLIDANSYPLEKIDSEIQLATKIMRAFMSNPCVAFSTKIFTTKENQQSKYFDPWLSTTTMKSMHAITPEKSQKVDSLGGTWLSCEVRNGRTDVVRELLKAGADIDQPNKNGVTPLYFAAQQGHVDVVRELINACAKIDQPNKNGVTPLFIAAAYDHVDVVRELIKARADIDQPDTDGVTPLFIAAQQGHVDVVRELINACAKIDQPYANTVTPLFIAAEKGHVDVVRELIKGGAKIDQPNRGGVTPLFIAARNGHVDVVRELIKARADIDQPNPGATPLFIAALCGHVDVVRELIKAGAKIDQPDIDGETPLYFAAHSGHVDVVMELINAGAKIDQPDTDGATPLFVAAQTGREKIVKLLLDHKADPNASISIPIYIILRVTDEKNATPAIETLLAAHYKSVPATIKNFTPLHIAALLGHKEVLQHLIDGGANITAQADGISPLELANVMKHQDIVTIIESKLQENAAARTFRPF